LNSLGSEFSEDFQPILNKFLSQDLIRFCKFVKWQPNQ
jgi:hypothetical protein